MPQFAPDSTRSSCDELIQKLERLVIAWRKQPSLAREYTERVRCRELIGTLKERYGLTYYIVAADDAPGGFRVSREVPEPTQQEPV